jgi:hypothetical protein
MLIDTYLPRYEYHERHSLEITAPPERVLRAIREITPTEIHLWRTLFRLRTLPARLLGRGRGASTEIRPVLTQMRRLGLIELGETPGLERPAWSWCSAASGSPGGQPAAAQGR